MSDLTHLRADGQPHMVDVGDKPVTRREATASGVVEMAPDTLRRLTDNPKGDVIGIATLAGIMGAKRTSDLIPLCHPLPLTKVEVDIVIDEAMPGLRISATARTDGKTGVEMEALTAVTVTALTLYDMLKAVDRRMVVGAVQLDAKSGGKSGDWSRARQATDGAAG